MGITAITIENFKGIREPVRVELKPITLLFGPNSAGKSTIVQALHYAREILERENLDPDQTIAGGKGIDLGGFQNLVHNHDQQLPVKLRIDFELKEETLPDVYELDENFDFPVEWDPWELVEEVSSASVEISIRWSHWRNKPVVISYEVGINGEILGRITSSADARQVALTFFNVNHPIYKKMESESWGGNSGDPLTSPISRVNIGIEGIESALPRWDEPIILETLDKVDINVLLVDMASEWSQLDTVEQKQVICEKYQQPLAESVLSGYFCKESDLPYLYFFNALMVGPRIYSRNELRKFHYLGPLREIPPRNYQPIRFPSESNLATGIAAWSILAESDSTFVDKVNDWLIRDDRLNSGYNVDIKHYREIEETSPFMQALKHGRIIELEDVSRDLDNIPIKKRIFLREQKNGIELLPQDVGVGISQVLPVIVVALYFKNGILAIEQPELHIHPAFQVALGDLFIEQIREHPEKIFILETHSEHIMLRFLRRIRETGEGALPPGAPELTPEALSIYFAEQNDDGITLSPIRVDEDGDFLDRWPHGFFRERAKELF